VRHPQRPPRWRRWLTLGNVATVAVLLWATPRLVPHLAAVVGVDAGDRRAPRYDVVTLDGMRLTPEALRGHVVLVNVWATWCGPCRAEMPLLERMAARHRARGLVVLGLSVDRAPDAVRAYLRSRGVTYPVAVVGPGGGGPSGVAAFGGVRGYPTSFLLDRDGVVRHAVLGPLAPASLEPAVRRLLAEEEEEEAGRPGRGVANAVP
jgi:cytochrome c biogenesis protein CcmG, thiol:disulfide interchange protein DsbE